MKRIFLAAMLLAATCAHAQKSEKTSDKTPVAQETFISDAGEKNIKVKSSNEKITNMLLKKFDATIVRYSVAYKKDRLGRYKEYAVVFSKDDQAAVTSFLKTLK